MKISGNAKKAILLGGLCAVAYLAVYIGRGVLSATTPQITQSGDFTTAQIGTLSSVCFAVYAIGQLINGLIGDRVKARYMLSLGLVLSSIGFLLLPQLTELPGYAYIAYGSTGFFMAMIYGPMTKVVSENTEPAHATRCSVGYTLSASLGSPIAGLMASALTWPWVFRSSGAILLIMGIIVFFCFLTMEKKGIVKYGQFARPKGQKGGIRILLKRQIVKFTFVAILTGVVRTTVLFWMPAYMSQHLGFAPEKATLIFSVASLVIAFSVIAAVILYERLHKSLNASVLVGFASSTLFFLLTFIVRQPILNVVCLTLAILCNNLAANLMWSHYCPSLYDTGMVSSATGYLDACSYLAAALSSQLFANVADTLGWSLLVLTWTGLMGLGIIVALPWKRKTAVN